MKTWRVVATLTKKLPSELFKESWPFTVKATTKEEATNKALDEVNKVYPNSSNFVSDVKEI